MKRLFVFLSLGFASIAGAQVQPPQTLKFKVGIGLGYQLCPERKALPTLQDAFLCSGLSGQPSTVELTLTNKPAADKNSLYYEAPYSQKVQFKDITVLMEALVMYAKANGQTYAFVDGRIISVRGGVPSQPIYFRSTGFGGFEKLGYQSTYGAMVGFPLGKETAEFSPYVTIAAPN